MKIIERLTSFIRHIILCALFVCAELNAEKIGVFTYETLDNTVTITRCEQQVTGAVEIPSTINGLPVTSISRAFDRCQNLTSVSIPFGVKTIGPNCFFECSSLQFVTIPDTIENIGDSAFYGCYQLKEITLPNGIKKINKNTFNRCINLESIIIPDSVEEIGLGAFHQCSSLTNIVVPNGVKILNDSVFSWCENLKSIILPETIVDISRRAFLGSNSLESITIPRRFLRVEWVDNMGWGHLWPHGFTPSKPSIFKSRAYGKAIINNGFITKIDITDRGDGYEENPNVLIVGEGNNNAIAQANVQFGELIEIKMINAGSGYNIAPLVIIDPPSGWLEPNLSIQLTPLESTEENQGTANPVLENGFLVDITVTNAGNFYQQAPAIKISEGGGQGAAAVAEITNGKISKIIVVNAGFGYTSDPTITISAPHQTPFAQQLIRKIPILQVTGGSNQIVELQRSDSVLGPWNQWREVILNNAGNFNVSVDEPAKLNFIKVRN